MDFIQFCFAWKDLCRKASILQIGNRFNVANVLLCSRCDLLTKNYNYDYKRIY